MPCTCSVFRKREKEQTITNVFPLLWPQGHCLLSRLHFNSTAIFPEVQPVRERHDRYQGQTNVSWVFVSILCFSLPSALLFVCFNGSDWNTAPPSDKNRTKRCSDKVPLMLCQNQNTFFLFLSFFLSFFLSSFFLSSFFLLSFFLSQLHSSCCHLLIFTFIFNAKNINPLKQTIFIL